MNTTRLILAVYIFLLLVGGIMGYAFSGSLMSLIASSLFGSLLLLSVLVSTRWEMQGLRSSLVLLVILTAFFAYRWFITSAFFPSGLFTCLSAVISTTVVYGIVNKK